MYQFSRQEEVNKLAEFTPQQCNLVHSVLLQYAGINDISLISMLDNLQQVEIVQTSISSVDVLQNCTMLQKIQIKYCANIDSINFLQNLPNLEHLILIQLKISQISFSCTNIQLKTLNINYCKQLAQIQGLENCINLQQLGIKETLVGNLTALKYQSHLVRLEMGNKDIQPITQQLNLKRLQELDISDTNIQVMDIPPQMNNVQSVNAANSEKLRQLTGLEHCWFLEVLDLRNTAIMQVNLPNTLINLKVLKVGSNDMPQINGKEVLGKLRELDVSGTNISSLNIQQEMKQLKQILAYCCSFLRQITGLENCHVMQNIDQSKTRIVNFMKARHESYLSVFISVPQSEIVVLDPIISFIDTEKILQYNKEIQQLTLIQCKCERLVESINEEYSLLQLLIQQFTPSCLTIINCSCINAIRTFINEFDHMHLKYNDITNLSFIQKQSRIKQLTVECCDQLANFDDLQHCSQLEQLILVNLKITNLSFIRQNNNIVKIELVDCSQFIDISCIEHCINLTSFRLIKTRVQDFSFLFRLKLIQYLQISNNYRQERLFQFFKAQNDKLHSTQQKQQLLFKSIKCTYYQLSKRLGNLIRQVKTHRNSIQVRNIVASKLCVDIITRMLYYLQ